MADIIDNDNDIIEADVESITNADGTDVPTSKPRKRGLNLHEPGDNAIPMHFRYGASPAVQDDLDPVLERYEKARLSAVTKREELMKKAADALKLFQEKGGKIITDADGNPKIDMKALSKLDIADLPLDIADEALSVQYEERKLNRRMILEYFRTMLDVERYPAETQEILRLPVSDPFWCERQDLALLRKYVRSFRQTYKV